MQAFDQIFGRIKKDREVNAAKIEEATKYLSCTKYPRYVEKLSQIVKPLAISLVVCGAKEMLEDPEQRTKLTERGEQFKKVFSETYSEYKEFDIFFGESEESLTGSDIRVVDVNDNELVHVKERKDKFLMSDMVIVLAPDGKIGVLKVIGNIKASHLVWGKSRNHAVITRLEDFGYRPFDDANITELATDSGWDESFCRKVLSGHHVFFTPEEFYVLYEYVGIRVDDLEERVRHYDSL